MKKITYVFLLMLVTILVFTSCATSVATQYMVPATYDMSSYRNLAIVSATPFRFKAYDVPNPIVRDMSGTSPIKVYSGYSLNSEKEMSEYLTSKVVAEANRTSYFTTLNPASADSLINRPNALVDRGYEALLTMWTEYIDIEEYISSREEKTLIQPEVIGDPVEEVITLVYSLEQKVSIQFGWEVKDLKTNAVLGSGTFRDSQSDTTKLNTEGNSTIYAPRLQPVMNSLASRFSSTIFSQLVPTTKTQYITLMKNDPKNNRAEVAYEYVKNGNMKDALDVFENEWNKRDHIPSAYNAALILEALNQRSDAIKLLEKVYSQSGNTKIRTLLQGMKSRLSSTNQAEKQL
ncbi:MAG: hypothetical protein EOM67_09420 [Spirochaetia bacterium]|nr:hypothetical protein [Spirochaetia bacterium]